MTVGSSASSPPARSEQTISYDTGGYAGTAYYGFPTEFCNAVGGCEQYGYDQRDMLSIVTGQDARQILYDLDGRIADLAAGNGGFSSGDEYQYAYDADGNFTREQEPQSDPAAATFNYGYYPDDKPKTLGISSSAYTKGDFEEYSYRADGGPQSLSVNGQGTISFTLTPAGRFSSRNMQWANGVLTAPETATYDAYGQVASMTFPHPSQANFWGCPATGFGNFKYDAAGDLLGYSSANNVNASGTTCGANNEYTGQSFSYTLRGELAGGAQYANGVAVNPGGAGFFTNFDDVMGAPLVINDSSGYYQWTYDRAGRMESETLSGSYGYTVSRTYDVENHVLTSGGQNYSWGPNGHPVQDGTPSW